MPKLTDDQFEDKSTDKHWDRYSCDETTAQVIDSICYVYDEGNNVVTSWKQSGGRVRFIVEHPYPESDHA